ncbi:hypothetical protein HELRODRAFT_177121 [Helobdella robusta]|uniref:Uncharacterized protein n=1 Tax=Helobdella robusta TaxID=6412 RepID=T1FB90_HELRO|nr:hypothetical protein HELRODRAFT_177121 [Helobdella robusta]ESN98241.1 hypothetical protein HELRODRAFT_177121 [Helobdella robusta]
MDYKQYSQCMIEVDRCLVDYDRHRVSRPNVKLQWTVSRKLLTKMKPSTKMFSNLELLAELEEEEMNYASKDGGDVEAREKISSDSFVADAEDDAETKEDDDLTGCSIQEMEDDAASVAAENNDAVYADILYYNNNDSNVVMYNGYSVENENNDEADDGTINVHDSDDNVEVYNSEDDNDNDKSIANDSGVGWDVNSGNGDVISNNDDIISGKDDINANNNDSSDDIYDANNYINDTNDDIKDNSDNVSADNNNYDDDFTATEEFNPRYEKTADSDSSSGESSISELVQQQRGSCNDDAEECDVIIEVADVGFDIAKHHKGGDDDDDDDVMGEAYVSHNTESCNDEKSDAGVVVDSIEETTSIINEQAKPVNNNSNNNISTFSDAGDDNNNDNKVNCNIKKQPAKKYKKNKNKSVDNEAANLSVSSPDKQQSNNNNNSSRDIYSNKEADQPAYTAVDKNTFSNVEEMFPMDKRCLVFIQSYVNRNLHPLEYMEEVEILMRNYLDIIVFILNYAFGKGDQPERMAMAASKKGNRRSRYYSRNEINGASKSKKVLK